MKQWINFVLTCIVRNAIKRDEIKIKNKQEKKRTKKGNHAMPSIRLVLFAFVLGCVPSTNQRTRFVSLPFVRMNEPMDLRFTFSFSSRKERRREEAIAWSFDVLVRQKMDKMDMDSFRTIHVVHVRLVRHPCRRRDKETIREGIAFRCSASLASLDVARCMLLHGIRCISIECMSIHLVQPSSYLERWMTNARIVPSASHSCAFMIELDPSHGSGT